jgi:ATP phosphoribosyltransferase regulatory subunit
VQKVYYNENVYRVAKGTHSFKEILQTGLECIGDIDGYALFETLRLAAESLRLISPDCVLDVSHLGLLETVLAQSGLSEPDKAAAVKCIGEKNAHELTAVCNRAGVSAEVTEVLRQLVLLYGAPATVLPKLRALLGDTPALQELASVTAALEAAGLGDVVRLDLSVISDMKYYSGIVFKGFVKNVPGSVLSGGRYDKLMKRYGNEEQAKRLLARIAKTSGKELPEEYR